MPMVFFWGAGLQLGFVAFRSAFQGQRLPGAERPPVLPTANQSFWLGRGFGDLGMAELSWPGWQDYGRVGRVIFGQDYGRVGKVES